MRRKQRLELTWIGKGESARLEPRLLIEDAEESYHAKERASEHDFFDNRLIFGDNLLALKALEQEFIGKIHCVYIDPPFNTGQAFEHYDDGIEHSIWLSLMTARLESIYRLLKTEGVLFVHLDQEENHYIKVVLDELFGRSNFLGQIAYERSGVSGIGQGGGFLVNTHEYILCYAKDKAKFKVRDNRGAVLLLPKDMKRYNRVFVSGGQREEVARFVAPATGEPVVIYRHTGFETRTISLRKFEERYDDILAEYIEHFPSIFRTTSVQEENEFQNRILNHCGDGLYSADYLVSRGRREGEQVTAYYLNGAVFAWLRDTAEVRDGQIVKVNKLADFWSHADLPKADLANEGGVDFRRGKKPETLIRRLLGLVTEEGDWVLDSFAGSGTTGAVAHKMRRKWIMVELRDHCKTHILPRLKGVIDGRDRGGVTGITGWRGGGGFRFYRLAPSLLSKDRWGNWVISHEYNPIMLAQAMCKLLGFTYAPSPEHYWMHGKSSERDFVYITTQSLTSQQLRAISEEVGDERTLLVCCKAFRGDVDQFSNLSVRKIPHAVLNKCEWGKDDYSLNVANLSATSNHATNGDAEQLGSPAQRQTELFAAEVV